MAEPDDTVNSPMFWERRYQDGQSGWDLGQPAPPFEHLLAGPDRPVPGRTAVLGVGRGHDALLFARHGFTVVGLDFAPTAIAAARAAASAKAISAEFVESDIFALPNDYSGAFDYVVEHTFFSAIDPTRRSEYVNVVQRLLRPGGELIGLFYAHGRPGGPPFSTSAEEVRELFSKRFAVEHLAPATNSIESRRGNELFARLRRL